MFRDISRAYLPADQGQLLIRAAGRVLAVYSECRAMSGAVSQPVPVVKKPVVARPDILKLLISPVTANDPSSDKQTSTTDKKRSVSVPESSPAPQVSAARTLSLIDTKPTATIASSSINTIGRATRSPPQKAIFVVPRQPPENAVSEMSRNLLSRRIDFTDEDVALDPVAALFPSLDTEENLDGKFTRLADGARVGVDLLESTLPAYLHSPEKGSERPGDAGDFNRTGVTESSTAVITDSMTEFMSPRLDDIGILTARGNQEASIDATSSNIIGSDSTSRSAQAPLPSSRLTQLQNSEPDDQDDTPTRGLKSILSDLTVKFNSVRLSSGIMGESSSSMGGDNYGIDANIESDGEEEDDDEKGENGKRNDSFSETWKTSVCITPGLPSPKSKIVESPDDKSAAGSTNKDQSAISSAGGGRAGPSPQKPSQTQAQSQAIDLLTRASTDSAVVRADLFGADSPVVSIHMYIYIVVYSDTGTILITMFILF
jgi:hypothetical protein